MKDGPFGMTMDEYVEELEEMIETQTAELREARTEIARCHERLEIDHMYEGDGAGGLKRVAVPYSERASYPDGIACRDDTIELQTESIDRLIAQVRALKGEA